MNIPEKFRPTQKYFGVVIIALIMSCISSRYLFVGSGLSVIPWGT